jgi:predicted nucleic acid-binding protein
VSSVLVLDSSVAAAWCFSDERTPVCDAIQDRLADDEAIVPEHWFVELTNALLVGERRKRISADDVTGFLREIGKLQIIVDDQLPHRAFENVLPLARKHRLACYDAAYLDLAMRLNVPLASLDDDLRRAAKAAGVKLLGK